MRVSNFGAKTRSFAVGVGVTVALSVGTLTSAAPASAAPTQCKGTAVWQTPGAYVYVCDAGSGYFRAVAYCSNTPGGRGLYRYGLWVGVDDEATSVAHCESTTYQYLVSGYGERRS